MSDKELLEMIVKTLVDNQEAVNVERNIDEMGVLLTLKVDPKDMGQVIGRQGQTARAIRTLLRVIGARNNARVNLKIVEPEGSRQSHRSEVADVDTSAVDDFKL
ncbi:MAG: RNA-binding protein [Candidatus Komeilibacteria bacterium CG_4_10_14_0_2_um_filter_37_10]|uniref:RNA-binding protein KhpA n=1 Tax=Candidatus Komeilibacteria bacterium CG_4_10_14_0_2_um_filter_37_10 TaxID=1974470 RepID=A0A2M7VEN4_9BACT|nr:MAG: RNA-binding protein [Candidatus Komeilibacteria bacterium CG_4_10_14_0_2_um_filter_37_10]